MKGFSGFPWSEAVRGSEGGDGGGREEIRNVVWEIAGKFIGIVNMTDEAIIHP